MFFNILLFKTLEKMRGVRGGLAVGEICVCPSLWEVSSPEIAQRKLGRGEGVCSSEQPVF